MYVDCGGLMIILFFVFVECRFLLEGGRESFGNWYYYIILFLSFFCVL